MSNRVYLPQGWTGLREVVALQPQLGALGNPPLTSDRSGHAVTDALRDALPELDDEELEHYAATEAAQDSLRHAGEEDVPWRRFVVAVDVDAMERTDDARPSAVRVEDVSVPRDVVAFLVDGDDAVEDVERAAVAAEAGSPEADLLLERLLEHELAWYAGSELDAVLSLH